MLPIGGLLIYHCTPKEDKWIYMWGQYRTEEDFGEINMQL